MYVYVGVGVYLELYLDLGFAMIIGLDVLVSGCYCYTVYTTIVVEVRYYISYTI